MRKSEVVHPKLALSPGAQFPSHCYSRQAWRPEGYCVSAYSAALSRQKQELSRQNRSIKLFFFKKADPLNSRTTFF